MNPGFGVIECMNDTSIETDMEEDSRYLVRGNNQ